MSSRNCERVGVAAEQDVLAVVDELAGLAILERGRASAEPRTRFEYEHARAALRQSNGCAQPGKSGTDDDYVVLRHDGHNHCLSAMKA